MKLFAVVSLITAFASGSALAQQQLIPYTLPSGSNVLQAKLTGPLPTYEVVCDSFTGASCAVLPGLYQLQVFDMSWRATKSEVVILPGSEPTDPDDTEGVLAPPSNLRFEFYSTFRGALSWDRPATPALRYEVTRNGQVVVASTDGINFQEREARILDRTNVYEVVAIAPDGRRSVPSRYVLESYLTNPNPGGGPDDPPDDEEGLASPTNLRFDFYSRFSGALSWDRPATPGLRYDVRRDGSIVAMATDGINFQERNKVFAEQSVAYDVTAIAPDGRRSSPSRLLIVDFEISTDGEPGPDVDPGPAPPSPTGLRFEYYSSTTGELFWDRSATPGLSYEVLRDGVVLDTANFGVNYRDFEQGLFEQRHVYEVIAIASDGARSAPSEYVHDPEIAPVAGTVHSARLPTLDESGFVDWPFDNPTITSLRLSLSVHARLPRAASGRQPRINDIFHPRERFEFYALVEEDGLIYDITEDGNPTLWFDVGAAIRASTGRNLDTSNRFHGGLRSAAFHPDFEANGKLYTSLMEERPTDIRGHRYLSDVDDGIAADSVVVEWSVDPRSMVVDTASYREVFRVGVPEYDHPIKQIEFDPSAEPGDSDYGLLYIGHGDGSIPSELARGGRQNDALGKVLRIDPLATSDGQPYRVPEDNPFVGDDTMLDEAFSIGHRNPHHLSFANDGTLLVADVGHDNVDEINQIVAGGDFGWAEREGAYVHNPSGGIFDGISALPADDALNGYIYPVVGYGHPGQRGAQFVGRAIGGGPVLRNPVPGGSGSEAIYLYTEFATTGEILYSRMRDIRAARTTGNPEGLTYAQTRKTFVIDFDTNGDPDAVDPGAGRRSVREVIAADRGYDGSGRVDLRLGADGAGRLFIMNKRNGVIYQFRLGGFP